MYPTVRHIVSAIFVASLLANSVTLLYYVQEHPESPCSPYPSPTPPSSLRPLSCPDLPPRPLPFSFYVLELPDNFTKAYKGWVDPLHTAFLSSRFRTLDLSVADLVIVPYYQDTAWRLYEVQQRQAQDAFIKKFEEDLIQWLESQEQWKLYKGIDHVFWSEEINPFLADHTMQINTPAFMRKGPISILCELPVPSSYEENLLFQHQIVIPYRETNPLLISEPYWSQNPQKKYLIQFCGSSSRYDHGRYVRGEILKHLNASQPDVHVFTYHEGWPFLRNDTVKEFLSSGLQPIMKESTFCISPHGDTPGARRMFDAILANCIPVIVADDVRLPFYGILNYSEFSIKIPEDQIDHLETTLRSIPKPVVEKMLSRIAEIRPYFVWNHPNASDARVIEMLEMELSFRAHALREHKHWVKFVKDHPQTQTFSIDFKMWETP